MKTFSLELTPRANVYGHIFKAPDNNIADLLFTNGSPEYHRDVKFRWETFVADGGGQG